MAEKSASFDVWMHEQGYTYNGDSPITGLTRFEMDKLQLGWIVKKEMQEEQQRDSPVRDTKASHKDSIKKRLRKN